MTDTLQTIGPESTMAELLGAFPGARRALFAQYHIGGCSSCAFSPEETVAQLCARNEDLPVEEVLQHVRDTHDEDAQILISPQALSTMLASDKPPRLLDIRTREEFDAVRLEGAELFTQDLVQDAFANWDNAAPVVIYDHTGTRCLDAAAYFIGHGFDAVSALEGGIDAYSRQVDSSLSRYRVEMDE